MILPDTSAWVEFDRKTGSRVDRRVAQLTTAPAQVAVTEPVVMEVLAGALSEQRMADLRDLLGGFPLLGIDVPTDFDSAAAVYRQCRRVGVTPRGLLDCLIAAVAWRHGATMLSNDRDMVRIAVVMGIDLDPASR